MSQMKIITQIRDCIFGDIITMKAMNFDPLEGKIYGPCQ